MRVARVPAQAKVNLLLRVGPRDTTGYHRIFTVFQRIDLADEVVVRVGGSVRALDCSGLRLPSGGLGAPEQNLAYRAAIAYAERTDWLRGFSIELTKHIPVGGGLGGGSADAGAVLLTLDALAHEPLGHEVLTDIGRALGADVNFLMSPNVLALGTNIGEQLTPLDSLPVREVLLAIPDFAIATKDAYRWLDDAGGGSMPPHSLPPDNSAISLAGADNWATVSVAAHNDFEASLELRYPKLRELRQGLGAGGARIARLSGSGSTVFGVFEGSTPDLGDLALDAVMIPTRTSARVVQVEVLE
jgi:4-diphosphocytidyl-2-C-methyl-D-erythritol kinase